MKINSWPGFKTRVATLFGKPDMRDTARPAAVRRHPSFLLPLLAISLSASLVEAQAAGPRASAAASIAAKRMQLPEAELLVVNEAQVEGINSIKVFHPRTGRIEEVNLDAENQEVPSERVEQALAARRQAGFRGKQEKALVDKVAGRPTGELTTVVVWVRLPGPPPRLDRPGASLPEPAVSAQAYRDFHRNATHGLIEQARARGWTVVYQSQDAPVVVLQVPNGQLQSLEARGDVETIYLGREYRSELNVSTAAMDAKGTMEAPKVWERGFTGSGVQVAVVETGAIYFDHANLANGTYCNPDTIALYPEQNKHATGVAGVIASTHPTYKGVAHGGPPLLNGNLKDGSDAELMRCTEWAINQGAKVLNFSFGDPTTSPYFGPSDRYVDYIIRNRAVTIVKAAGNIDTDTTVGTCFSPNNYVTSPGKGYNVLTVGNYNDRGTISNLADPGVNNADIMSATSCYGNPYSMFSEREKPEIVAPGVNITTTYCTDSSTCTGTTSGTSFAAPHVTGCAALLMQRNQALTSWPEAIRAILMASAVTNIEGPTVFSADLTADEKDGVGGIECDSADDIVSGAAGGEQHVPVTSTNFPRDFTFNATAGRTVRAVIAWDSTPSAPGTGTAPTSDPLLADLELAVYAPNGTVVATSYSRDNSFEIVEFTAPSTGTYTARVFAKSFQGASEYLAFAWWQGAREK